ncbi:MAG: SPOR domain-containing protein [Rectinemataceae bacterium]|nr:SPOR domain-containing protein [Rectinemataceae bacterium]
MSEDQKPENSRKFLWLAAAVSLFVLIVVGAAFLIFSPGKSASQEPFDLSGKAEERQENPQDFLANAPAEPSTTQTTSSGDIIIVYGNDQNSAAPAPAPSAQPATTTIYVEPVAPTTPTTVKPAAAPVAKVTTTTKAPVVKAPVAKTAPAAQPATGDYWIQAGSFSVKNNADALKSTMAGSNLPAVITVKDIDGKSRYIVRVGPYPTRAEATKWLPKVKSVKGAEQSWITQ